jgi:hypothetical protein
MGDVAWVTPGKAVMPNLVERLPRAGQIVFGCLEKIAVGRVATISG